MDVSRSHLPPPPIAATPRPGAGVPPRIAAEAAPKAAGLGADRIDVPVARQPAPPGHSGPPARADSRPLLLAGAVVAAGVAVIAAPELEAAFAASEGLAAVGAVLARGGAFLADVGREIGPAFRAGASKFTDLKYTDPKELGRALGEQAWTATEELGRGSLVGAGLAGGAAAAHQLGASVVHLIDEHRSHANR